MSDGSWSNALLYALTAAGREAIAAPPPPRRGSEAPPRPEAGPSSKGPAPPQSPKAPSGGSSPTSPAGAARLLLRALAGAPRGTSLLGLAWLLALGLHSPQGSAQGGADGWDGLPRLLEGLVAGGFVLATPAPPSAPRTLDGGACRRLLATMGAFASRAHAGLALLGDLRLRLSAWLARLSRAEGLFFEDSSADAGAAFGRAARRAMLRRNKLRLPSWQELLPRGAADPSEGGERILCHDWRTLCERFQPLRPPRPVCQHAANELWADWGLVGQLAGVLLKMHRSSQAIVSQRHWPDAVARHLAAHAGAPAGRGAPAAPSPPLRNLRRSRPPSGASQPEGLSESPARFPPASPPAGASSKSPARSSRAGPGRSSRASPGRSPRASASAGSSSKKRLSEKSRARSSSEPPPSRRGVFGGAGVEALEASPGP